MQSKYELTDWDNYEWGNFIFHSIPLPKYQVGDRVGEYEIVTRWYIPDEAPCIPTGWIYKFRFGHIIPECQL